MGGFKIRNKLIFIGIIITILISVNCAHATKINDTATNETLTFENGDFSSLNNKINNSIESEIKLDKDYTFNPETDGQFTDGIEITHDNLVIDGQGHTIDANRKAKVFSVKADNVILKNINIINGYSSTPGGAVYLTGNNNTIEHCLFKNCYSSRYGGAVSFKLEGTVRNCSFENNNAPTGGGLDFGNIAHVIDSRFTNNSATFLGGAITFYGLSTVENSVFEKNIAGDGAGIYTEAECHINNSTFNLNHALGYGGGIYLMRSGMINNSVFSQNSALEGGAIIIKSESLNVNNSIFDQNNADNGISIYALTSITQIENSSFNNINSSLQSEICIERGEFISHNMSFNNISKQDTTDESNQSPINANTVIKKKTSLKAKSKTFKVKNKSKKITITLKSGKKLLKNKKIKLRINGKTYSKKTNKKGQATIKIKINRKGTFKATIRFGGDKNYKSSKKIVKIKIK